MTSQIVIVGAGQAAGQVVDTLVRGDFPGQITLIGEERHPPYQRPPLSKKLLAGEMAIERTYIKAAGHYAEHDVSLHLAQRAVGLHRAHQMVELDDGQRLDYNRLVLATGARARRLDLPGAELSGVHTLRTIDDVETIRPRLRQGASLVVVGGGFIGLEVAAVAVGLGLHVTVLEAAPRLLARVMPPAMSSWYEALHRAHGVTVRCDARVHGFEGDTQIRGVKVDDGSIPADLVIVGIGVVPNTELADAAGIDCDDGILVDEHCRTSDPLVYAAGDCTRHPQPLLGTRVRLESVHNAMSQGRVTGANLLGQDARYQEMPWFWSDQFDVKLQMIGLSRDHDQAVVRGDMDGTQFAVFYLRGGVLIAADVVNNPREFMLCRKLVPRLVQVDPQHLADPEFPLQDVG